MKKIFVVMMILLVASTALARDLYVGDIVAKTKKFNELHSTVYDLNKTIKCVEKLKASEVEFKPSIIISSNWTVNSYNCIDDDVAFIFKNTLIKMMKEKKAELELEAKELKL